MRTPQIVWFIFFIIILGVLGFFFLPKLVAAPETSSINTQPTQVPVSQKIQVTTPTPGSTISSPISISGKALGSWYFEATFPVEILDNSGTVIAQDAAQTQSDWMVNGFAPFTATIDFPPQHPGNHGTIVLKKDNPSGDPANDEELDIPIVF